MRKGKFLCQHISSVRGEAGRRLVNPISHGFRLRLKAEQGSLCQHSHSNQGQRGRLRQTCWKIEANLNNSTTVDSTQSMVPVKCLSHILPLLKIQIHKGSVNAGKGAQFKTFYDTSGVSHCSNIWKCQLKSEICFLFCVSSSIRLKVSLCVAAHRHLPGSV